MPSDNGLFGLYSKIYENQREVEMSVDGYLGKCADDPGMMVSIWSRSVFAPSPQTGRAPWLSLCASRRLMPIDKSET